VIATRCGGPESFIDDSAGILVDKNDSLALSIAMVQMIENQSTYKADDIRKYTIENFGKECFLHRVEQIYNAAISA
jgi:glycosyltransferase involved in cell wall biosynthesis